MNYVARVQFDIEADSAEVAMKKVEVLVSTIVPLVDQIDISIREAKKGATV